MDLANAFLKLGNTPFGTIVTQIGLLTGVLWGGSSLINAMKIGQVAINQWKKAALGVGQAATKAIPSLSKFKTLLAMPLPVAVGVAGLVALLISLKKAYDKANPSIKEINEKIGEQNLKLTENEEKLRKISSIPYNARTTEIQAEKEALEQENQALKDNIEHWEKKKAKSQYKSLMSDDKYRVKKNQTIFAYTDINTLVGIAESEEELLKAIKKTNPALYEQADTLEETGLIIQKTGDQYESAADSVSIMSERYNELIEKAKSGKQLTADEAAEVLDLHDKLTELGNGYKGAAEGGQELEEWQQKLVDSNDDVESSFKEISGTLYDVNDVLLMASGGASMNSVQFEILKRKAAEFGVTETELTKYVNSANGMFTLQVDALNNAAIAGDKYAQSMVDNMIEALDAIIDATNEENNLLLQQAGSLYFSSEERAKLIEEIRANNDVILSASATINKLKSGKKSWIESPGTTSYDAGAASTTGSKTKADDPIKKQNDLFKEQNAILEHNIFLKQKQGASEQDLIKLYKAYQDEIHRQANWYRAQGLDENSEYIRDVQKQWWELADTIKELEEQITEKQREAFDKRLQLSEKYIEDRNNRGDWGADSEIAAWERVLKWQEQWYKDGLIDYEYYLQQREEALKRHTAAVKASLEKQKNDYEIAFDYVASQAQKEIDSLNKQKDAIRDKYDSQIEALQKTNEELENQIELEEALDALARAKQTKVMVYKEGKFQYLEDVDAVSEAQSSLEKVQREQALKQEVENLEELRDKEIESIDNQIEYWEKYKEEWSSVVDKYQEEQNKLIAEQVLGTKLEGENWEKRLKSLQEYVNRYLEIMKQLEQLQDIEISEENNNKKPIKQGGAGGTKGFTGSVSATLPNGKTTSVKYENGNRVTEIPKGTIVHTAGGSFKYANGTTSAHGGMSLVGERGAELRVLNKGDGIIPANVTKNLWAWGETTPIELMGAVLGSLNGLAKSTSIVIQNFNPNLPNITDGEGFANYLCHSFGREVLQFANI